MFNVIAAVDDNNGIAKNGIIPWNVPEDMKYFRDMTTNCIVIMGRKTYESIGKPLPNRINYVISSKEISGITTFKTFQECVKAIVTPINIYIIGGLQIYRLFYENNLVSKSYITHIKGNYECDLTFNEYLSDHSDIINVIDKATFKVYHHKNTYELKMLRCMSDIIDHGDESMDRTNVGTLRLFGEKLEFDLTNNQFPLMTTRKLSLRMIFEELMLYLRGQTDSKILEEKGINVWKHNTTREFLDSRNLHHLPVGDMGHSYGFSFRHYGAKYINCKTDYKEAGFDQLKYLINEIKTNPSSRRLRITLYEPDKVAEAALPPCLEQYQFYVNDGYLSCMMMQRSSDFFTAGGWNVATGSLLVILLAHICNLKPKKLIWVIGDIHIYKNLIDKVKLQLVREPYLYPKLYLKDPPNTIEDFTYENLQLLFYNYHESIKTIIN
jgi:dihydrofolate reductase/thymidylate synthase